MWLALHVSLVAPCYFSLLLKPEQIQSHWPLGILAMAEPLVWHATDEVPLLLRSVCLSHWLLACQAAMTHCRLPSSTSSSLLPQSSRSHQVWSHRVEAERPADIFFFFWVSEDKRKRRGEARDSWVTWGGGEGAGMGEWREGCDGVVEGGAKLWLAQTPSSKDRTSLVDFFFLLAVTTRRAV